jgi:hypothetical protein
LRVSAGHTVVADWAWSTELRAAITAEDSDALAYGALLVNEMIRPLLAEIERTVSVTLGRIRIDDMVRRVAVPK